MFSVDLGVVLTPLCVGPSLSHYNFWYASAISIANNMSPCLITKVVHS